MKDMSWLITIIISGTIIVGFIIGYICRKSKTIRAAFAKNRKLLTEEDVENLKYKIKNTPIAVATLMIPDTDAFATSDFYKETLAVGHSISKYYVNSMGEDAYRFFTIKEIQIDFKKKLVYIKTEALDKSEAVFKYNPAHLKIFFNPEVYWHSNVETGIQLW